MISFLLTLGKAELNKYIRRNLPVLLTGIYYVLSHLWAFISFYNRSLNPLASSLIIVLN